MPSWGPSAPKAAFDELSELGVSAAGPYLSRTSHNVKTTVSSGELTVPVARMLLLSGVVRHL